jgi:hypothetical protein
MAELLGKRADTVFDMYKLEETNRNALRVANVRGTGAGAGGGNKWTDLTAAQQMDARNKATTAWGNLSGIERLKANKEVGREAWIENQAKYLATGASGGGVGGGTVSPEDEALINKYR